jgi:predicted small secreted protein
LEARLRVAFFNAFRRPVMKQIAALIAVAFALAVPLGGCNTFRGAGQDIQKGGEKVEDAAKKRQ